MPQPESRLSHLRRRDLIYLVLSVVLVIGGYLWLRAAYAAAQEWPFTQEVLLVILGIVATVLITALLLNRQTEVELEKEWSIKLSDLKQQVYIGLLEQIEHMLGKGGITPEDRLRMQFLTHRLAIVAAPNVLEEYENFLEIFTRTSSDSRFTAEETAQVNEALARLTAEIRRDLLGDEDLNMGYSERRVRDQIMENTRHLK